MCTRPRYIRCPPNPFEYINGVRTDKIIQVPCGKCPECLANRQKDLALRAFEEAKKYGSCRFVTLTYAPAKVPFSQTLLAIDTDTGDCRIERCAELVSGDIIWKLRKGYKENSSGVYYHYADIARFEDTLFQVVYTPTLYYTDVRLCIKYFRVKYFRDYGVKLNFTYTCVGEYGSKPGHSHRPHYHILFFGLTEEQTKYFMDLWSSKKHYYFGKAYYKPVKHTSDDLAKVASYIGKYSAKGTFNPSSVVQHYTLPCRISSSRGLGLSDLEKLKSHYYGFDIVGKYDINKCDFNYDKSLLYRVLYDRLTFNFNGKEISLPNSFRRKIFDCRNVEGKTCWSRLYYEIMDFARSVNQTLSDFQFEQYRKCNSEKSLSQICSEFESIRASTLAHREKSEKEYLSRFYALSKF